jgi:outer membrane lipoprotein SlyB
VGAKAESALTKAQGMEYTIKLDDGEVISVVQAIDPKAAPIMAGDAVKLLSQGGTFRVTKLASTRY